MNIKYIANVRIPTTRAQGYAIMKMCSEFSKAENEVELFVPTRGNNENKQDPFDYYKIEKNFEIKKVPSFDFLGKTLKFGRIFYWIDILSFLFMSRLKIDLSAGDVLYTRDFMTTLFFSKKHFIALELHDISSSSFFFKRALKKVSVFFVLNNYLKQDLVSFGVSSDKVFISPSGVELKDFEMNIDTNEARKKVGLPLDKKIVSYTGQFYTWKGVDTLAETAKLLPEILFVFVGGAEPEYSLFKKRYEGIDNIITRSFQERLSVITYMTASDILALPNSGNSKISSRYTSPLKLFEYMATKRPIIASDLPSIREILTEEECVFAETDNPENFAIAIRKILADFLMADRMAQKANSKVQQYSWQNRVKKIVSEIQSYGHKTS